ncbi:MAG: M1 family aminopeptidase [Pseudomonadota bacterium]
MEFATTPPLSSYLVAFGVGPFDVVDGGSAGKNRVPLRYITPKGRGAEAAYAAQVTPDLLVLLEEYFGRPYPFAKLDSMVIPVTVNFGAMENAGLITYRSSLMLAPHGSIDERFQQRYASIAAHEIAHQWFGNLVTMNWWNDIWLNESFATWMARKVVARFNPSWEEQAGRLHERNEAIAVDRLESTRQIRQAVERQDDLSNAFDRITYSKGGAVLTMFESWLGEERFRAGVRRYLDKHAFANASAEDFFAALAQSDQELARAFQSFVEQPGVPQVAHGLECSDGRAALTLAQKRFRPLPSASAAQQQAWRIPVCVRYAGQDGAAPLCHLLDTATARIPLPGASHCPAWVLPNPGGIGYYLSTLSAPLLTVLESMSPTAAESAALLSDLDLLARAGAFPYDQVLGFAAAQSGGPPQAALAAVAVLHGMHPALLEGEEKSSFATWLRKHFGERARSLGWLPRADESDATQRLRRALLPLLADVGADAELRAKAQTLAKAWLKGEQALGGMRLPLLGSAARNADATFFEALAGKAKQALDSSERNDVYQALGVIADPVLRELAFLLVLDPGHDARESVSILQNAANSGDYAVSLQAFLQSRYDELLSRLPADYGARLPELGRLLCDANARNAFEAWFAPRAKKYPGGIRNFAQALESIDICLASRTAQRKPLANFLVDAH